MMNIPIVMKGKIEIVGIKGSKKFMTRRERDALRSNNGFTFFDS